MKQARGFTLLELLLASSVLILLLTFLLPWAFRWQRWAAVNKAQAILNWENDFLAHRLYNKALQTTSVKVSAGEVQMTYADLSTIQMGVSTQRAYESSGGSKRYLTNEPLIVGHWQPQITGSLLQVGGDLSLYQQTVAFGWKVTRP